MAKQQAQTESSKVETSPGLISAENQKTWSSSTEKKVVNENTRTSKQPSISNVHELSRDEPYLERILRIKDECSKQDSKQQLSKTKTTFKYVDEVKLVMCETPKVASTTWQLVLLRLGGYKGNFTSEILKKWAYSIIPNKTFKNMTAKKIWEKMSNYTTFLITRHPFERLVSAFYDKFSNHSQYTYYRNGFGRQIAKMQASKNMHGLNLRDFQKNFTKASVETLPIYQSLSLEKKKDVIHYLRVLETGEISFHQLVQYLCDYPKSNNPSRMDIHWRPQSSLCQPCLFNYSYVMKFENLNHDSNRLLEYLQTSYNLPTSLIDQVRFNKQVSPGTKNKLTEETMRLIPESQVETLRKIYRDDFRLYDYDPYSYKGF